MESARNIAAAQTKKLREYAKPREYLSGEASLRVRNISERRYIYGDERRAEMERLTKRNECGDAYYPECYERCYGEGSSEKCNDCDYDEKICDTLADYEDTGLTPPEIMDLKERDTAKPPIDIEDNYGFFVCPSCGNSIYASDDFESHKFCLNCGQRIQWRE